MALEFINREILVDSNLDCAERVENKMYIEGTDVLVVYYHTSLKWEGHDSNEPFHMFRHDYNRDRGGKNFPVQIAEIADSTNWHSFIWFPYEVSIGDKYRFTIRYAHEFQHYRQFHDGTSLQHAREYLRESSIPLNKRKYRIDHVPSELDADRVAVKVFLGIHGHGGYEAFVKSESKKPNMARYFAKLNLKIKDMDEKYEAIA